MRQRRLQEIRLLIMDVDGVLTDGQVVWGNAGEQFRAFSVQDGLGIRLWHMAGGISGIITSKSSLAVRDRARDLHITAVAQNSAHKFTAYEKMRRRFRLDPRQVCYMGDDLIDIPVLKDVGFAVAVPEAPEEVQRVAHYVTRHSGGRGAVREIVGMILKAQKRWDPVIKRLEA